MNYYRVLGWSLFSGFILVIIGAIVSAGILLSSRPITPHTVCLPGFAPPDSSRYGECVPCGWNRYSSDGIFCLDCPSKTYTCENVADSINSCSKCSNISFDVSINATICKGQCL